jgi:hypothetical protein
LLTAIPVAPPKPDWTSVNAVSTLLTVESFLFGFVNVVIGVMAPSALGNRLVAKPRGFALSVAWLITGIAIGAVVAWADLFVSLGHVFAGKSAPDHLGGWIPAFVVLGAICLQPVFVWRIVKGIRNPAAAPPPQAPGGPAPAAQAQQPGSDAA